MNWVLRGERRPLPADSVVELIRRQVVSRPDAVAVEFTGGALSYIQLWRTSGAIADVLRETGVVPGDLVAVWAERTPLIIATMLATMAVGATYVPLDPDNPTARAKIILGQAQPRVLVHVGASVGDIGFPTVDVSDVSAAEILTPGMPDRALPGPHDLAYAVYTSGSTGVPKGVLIEHRSLVNYVCWAAALMGEENLDCPLFASLGFDLALTTLWVPLSYGRRIALLRRSLAHDGLFSGQRHGFIKMTPSHARLFQRVMQPRYQDLTNVVMMGGESLDPNLAAGMSGVRVINHYGPTETTIGCCAYEVDSTTVIGLPSVPIGRPAWNTNMYVLDDCDRLAPSGELVVSGFGIARGYVAGEGAAFLDAAELGDSGQAYRTGDQVEVLPDGKLLCLGRIDGQVKVNGYRLESVELRRHLLALPNVIDADFDVIRGSVADRIEAFVVGGQGMSESAMLKILASQLPKSLLPQSIHVVDEIRLSANGKRDIRATRRAIRESLHEIRGGLAGPLQSPTATVT